MNKATALIETREAFWTAAALRRFFDASPKMDYKKTPANFNRSHTSSPFPSALPTAHKPTLVGRVTPCAPSQHRSSTKE
jgi:hypothetical protein